MGVVKHAWILVVRKSKADYGDAYLDSVVVVKSKCDLKVVNESIATLQEFSRY